MDESYYCPECGKLLEDPRVLPCGDSICSSCADSTIKNKLDSKNQFVCSICNNFHTIPKSGFLSNNYLSKLVNNHKIEICKNDEIIEYKALMGQIKLKLNEFMSNRSIKSNETIIRETCDSIRNQISSIKESIYVFSRELSEQVSGFEDKCIKNLENMTLIEKDLKPLLELGLKLVDESNSFFSQFDLRNSKTSKEKIVEAKKLSESLSKEINQYQKKLFQGEQIDFYSNLNKLSSSAIGRLVIKKIDLPDLKEMQSQYIGKYDYHLTYNIISLEFFCNNNYLISFYSKYKPGFPGITQTSLILYDQFKNQINTFTADVISKSQSCSCVWSKRIMLFHDIDGSNYLKVFDKNLNIKKSIGIPYVIISMAANDFGILCLENFQVFNIYDYNLELIMKIHSNFISMPIVRVKALYNSKVFLLGHNDCISMMDMGNGLKKKTLNIKCDYFVVNRTNQVLICLNKADKKLMYYNLDGEKINENDLTNIGVEIEELCVDWNDNLVILDKKNSTFYR